MGETKAGAGWHIAIWIGQIMLAAIYLMAGIMKLSQSIDGLVASGMAYAGDYPELLTRFIGTLEILGAVGIILPAATRIIPVLTPLAAIGFGLIQVLAFGLHTMRGEYGVLPVNLVLLAVALFVVWGRLSKAPITSR
ncbi:DoxX family protein [Devosia sp. Naph2]|uniref:DoxX family protein n=1 Tax=Devosia polycyclovorans TaxID=3345148 RepID=UPI0035D02BB9